MLSFIRKITDAWLAECKQILKDEGVLLFFVFLPLAYPIAYSWVYNNEVVREVPIVVVDNSNTALSREFVQRMDATPDVDVAFRSSSIEAAKTYIGHGQAYGIVYIPSDFSKDLGRMKQTHVSVYCDMSYMLTYKAIYSTAVGTATAMNVKLQKQMLAGLSDRQLEITTKPLDFDEVSIFNTTAGYGNFILPGVLVLIIQQALVLGVGMLSGTERERKFAGYAAPPGTSVVHHSIALLFGKSLCYLLIFAIMLAWVTLIVPRLFGFVSMVHGSDLLQFLVPYLLACIAMAFVVSELIRYRESVMLVVVFTSIPLLFMSGVSWPQSSIPGMWQGVSVLFPSTFCIRGFIRMSSMGALLPDVKAEYQAMWIQACVYTFIALGVVWRRVRSATANEK